MIKARGGRKLLGVADAAITPGGKGWCSLQVVMQIAYLWGSGEGS